MLTPRTRNLSSTAKSLQIWLRILGRRYCPWMITYVSPKCSHCVCRGQRQRKIGHIQKTALLSQRLEWCSVSQRSSRGCWHLVFSPVRAISDSWPPVLWDKGSSSGLHSVWGETTTKCFFHSFSLVSQADLELNVSRRRYWRPHLPVPENWDSRPVPTTMVTVYQPSTPSMLARQGLYQLSYISSLDSVFKE